jgi:hypothetical protein
MVNALMVFIYSMDLGKKISEMDRWTKKTIKNLTLTKKIRDTECYGLTKMGKFDFEEEQRICKKRKRNRG